MTSSAACVAGLGALSLIGCGDDSNDGGGGDGDSKPPPKPTGIARFGYPVSGTKSPADPGDSAQVNVDFARIYNITEPMARATDPNSSLRLAESIEAVGNDATVWDVTVKEVEFSNGKPVRPEDIIATVRRLSDPATSLLANSFGDIKDMKKTGPRTVRFTMNTPIANFVSKVGIVLFAQPEDWDPMKPIGSGPYMLESWVRGRKTVLKANPNYRGPGPYIETIELIEFADDDARVNALLAGQIDAIESVPTGPLKAITDAGHNFVEGPSDSYVSIAMHTQKAPYNDPRVRQAIRLIANREQIVSQVFGGHAELGNDMVSLLDPEYPKDLPQREQDIEQAKSLLKAAGQEGMNIELVTSLATASGPQLAQVFVEQAKQAGVTVKLKQIDPAQFYTPESGYLSHPIMTSAGATPYLTVASIALASGAPFNETHWNDAEWIKLYKEALSTVDDTKRKEIVSKLMTIEYERGGSMVAAFNVNSTAAKKSIKGLKSQASNTAFNQAMYETLWVDAS
ncbi:MAG TPA: ABC transporter substrate-binding protein [Baekduia sp.]|nr:ABC transporter substrate-binding protein [Baekduia sp.]